MSTMSQEDLQELHDLRLKQDGYYPLVKTALQCIDNMTPVARAQLRSALWLRAYDDITGLKASVPSTDYPSWEGTYQLALRCLEAMLRGTTSPDTGIASICLDIVKTRHEEQ